MVNGLDCRQQYSLYGMLSTRVGMAVKAWEIAAGDLQTDVMTSIAYIACGTQVNLVRVDSTWPN